MSGHKRLSVFILSGVLTISFLIPGFANAQFTQYLSIGSSGNQVAALQELLKSDGIFTYSAITGYYGKITAAAVAAFQRTQGIDPIGSVGPLTRKSLNILLDVSSSTPASAATTSTAIPFTRYLYTGISGTDVAWLQEFLKGQGFFTYPKITNYYGSITAAAVSLFQKANDIESTGTVGPVTRALIVRILSLVSPVTTSNTATSTGSTTPNSTTLHGGGGGGSSGGESVPPAVVGTTSGLSIIASSTVFGTSVTLSPSLGGVVSPSNIIGIQYELDGTVIGSSPYSYNWNTTTASDGPHTLSMVISTSYGETFTSPAQNIVVDNHGISYYISPTGNDSNNGLSSTTPWQTINQVNNSIFYPGDKILFQGGQNFPGCILLSQSNTVSTSTNGTPITIDTYGTGEYQITASCAGTNTIRSAAVKINGANNIVVQNGLLRGDGTPTTMDGVYMNNPTSATTGNITIRNMDISGFYLNSSSEYAADIYMDGYEQGGPTTGLTNIQLLNNQIHGQSATSTEDNGVLSVGYGENLSNVLVQGNTIYNIGGNKVNSYTGSGLLMDGMKNGVVQYNSVHDIGGNGYSCGGPSGMYVYSANNIVFQYNEVYNVRPVPSYTTGCDFDGIDIDGDVTNSVMQYNYVHDNWGAGLYLYTSGSSNNTIRYNISQNNGTTTQANGFGDLALGSGSSNSGNYVYNNTLYSDGPAGSTIIGVQGGNPTNTIVANNILYSANGADFFYDSNSTAPTNTLFENNDYYAASSFTIKWNSTKTYTSLAAFQASTTEDVDSTTTNPLIVNPGTASICNTIGGYAPQPCPSNYALQATSTLIGAGLNLSNPPFNLTGITQDYYGNILSAISGARRSIGAYEGTSTLDVTAPTITINSPTATSTISGTAVVLAATARDNVQVQSVYFAIDGIPVGQSIGTSATSSYQTIVDSSPYTNGTHTLTATAEDTAGNSMSTSTTFTVSNGAPIISAVATSAGWAAATITWTTNVPTTSQVSYGTTASYGSSVATTTLSDNHSISLSGLSQNTTYHFQITSTDGGGRTATSSDQVFTTSIPPTDPNGLMLYYPMDTNTVNWTSNTIQDLTGNGYTGNLYNMTASSSVQGQIAQALKFNGTSSYIDGETSAYSDSLTLSAWVNPSAYNSVDTIFVKRNLIGTVNSAPASEYNVSVSPDGTITAIFYDNTSSATLLMTSTTTEATVPLNTWSFIAVTVPQGAGGTGAVYLNGLVVATSTKNAVLANTGDDIQIGARSNNNSARYFPGNIDDVRIYDRVLSANEITNIYQAGLAGNP